ncbi:hypothetical protein [Enterovibrio norvegicus]|uniref:hypothetical protein n=1 Tax=Enterovibrio norvegicus TaxID=188144 RepID=UPI000C85D178|nr:hypothetical protein [Enterovibrio norvegicus]PMN66135.1 hypothetical protein BCT27_24695 [Enterovibrio norvegicus]
MKELNKIEQLLYGLNYEVKLYLFGPGDCDTSLEKVLHKLISEDCISSGIVTSSSAEARNEIMDMVLYEGNTGSGPIDLESKKSEIASLIERVFNHIHFDSSEMIIKFNFYEGHPSSPVFWDFAFDIHSQGKRWIFVGSSSD